MSDPTLSLRDPEHRVSTRAPVVWAASALVADLVVLAGLVVAQGFGWWDVPWWAWTAYAVGLVVHVGVVPLVRYRVHRWESTATAVITRTGWLTQEVRVAPMSRVQTVDLEQGVVERVCRLASVTVTTASAAGPLRIQGVDLPVARRLVEDLTRRAGAEPGDAT
ncbi:PH domain-containing protein [Nocardioides korecus]